MGDNLNEKKTKKKTGHLFLMRNPYMNFRNISIHGSKLMLAMHMKATNGQKLQRAITLNKFH